MNLKHIRCLERVNLWNSGFAELWDFSNTNSSQEAREESCAFISQVCHSKTIANPKKHYQRLKTENGGRASEVLGFIPVSTPLQVGINLAEENFFNNFARFGFLKDKMLYSNLRAVLNFGCDASFEKDLKDFIVMKIKIPYMVVDHFRRHGMLNIKFAENWQSHRSGHKKDYFENEETKEWDKYLLHCKINDILEEDDNVEKPNIRQELTNKGSHMLRYVTGWIGGWIHDPMTWDNMFRVRGAKNTQKESQELVRAMKQLVKKHYDYEEIHEEEILPY